MFVLVKITFLKIETRISLFSMLTVNQDMWLLFTHCTNLRYLFHLGGRWRHFLSHKQNFLSFARLWSIGEQEKPLIGSLVPGWVPGSWLGSHSWQQRQRVFRQWCHQPERLPSTSTALEASFGRAWQALQLLGWGQLPPPPSTQPTPFLSPPHGGTGRSCCLPSRTGTTTKHRAYAHQFI